MNLSPSLTNGVTYPLARSPAYHCGECPKIGSATYGKRNDFYDQLVNSSLLNRRKPLADYTHGKLEWHALVPFLSNWECK